MKKQYIWHLGLWVFLLIINLVLFVINIITKNYDMLLSNVSVMLFIASLIIQELRLNLKDKLCEYYKNQIPIQEFEENETRKPDYIIENNETHEIYYAKSIMCRELLLTDKNGEYILDENGKHKNLPIGSYTMNDYFLSEE